MKSLIVATLLIISSFAIALPVNAQTAIVAALYQNSTAPQTQFRYENDDISRNQIILAVNTTPEIMAISESLISGNSYDRIVTMSQKDNLACLVSGKGSVDGTVMCGFLDHE